jgi:hypothetical protein
MKYTDRPNTKQQTFLLFITFLEAPFWQPGGIVVDAFVTSTYCLSKKVIMKKIIFGLLFIFAAATQATAQTDTSGTKYWYYPGQNIYYNDATGDYWYYDKKTTRWADTKTLPDTYTMQDTDDRYPVYYNGTDVWRNNKTHTTKYKAKKNGTVKQKTRSGS